MGESYFGFFICQGEGKESVGPFQGMEKLVDALSGGNRERHRIGRFCVPAWRFLPWNCIYFDSSIDKVSHIIDVK